MLIKGLVDEDFVNYKLPSMYIATATCSFKCDKEYGQPICQNSELAKQPDIDIPITDIIMRYLANPITKAIVFGGLEPFDQRYPAAHQRGSSSLRSAAIISARSACAASTAPLMGLWGRFFSAHFSCCTAFF